MPQRLVSLVVIPARLNSSRFPGKILHPIAGKPMIQWVYENSVKASRVDRVFIATDSLEIANAAEGFGGAFLITPRDFQSGTDRIAWAVKDMSFDVVVNVQGDEPLLPPEAIDRLVGGMAAHPEWDMATLSVRKDDPEGLADPNVVKLREEMGIATGFSRTAYGPAPYLKHVGVYAYRKAALKRLSELPPSPLELSERLEQIRALEQGYRIGSIRLYEDTIGVDVREDVAKVERMMQRRFHKAKS